MGEHTKNISTMLIGTMLVVTTFGLFRGDTPVNMKGCGFIFAALIIVAILSLTVCSLWFFYSFYYRWAKSYGLFRFILLCMLYSLFPLLIYNFIAVVSHLFTGKICLYEMDKEQLGLTIGYALLMIYTTILIMGKPFKE